jgi:hypothetical protein
MDRRHATRSETFQSGGIGYPMTRGSAVAVVPHRRSGRRKKRFGGLDRRMSPRFAPVTGAVAFLRPDGSPLPAIAQMSLGDIGMAVLRARPSKLGRIKDISLDGLAFYYVEPAVCTMGGCALDILYADRGFYLCNLNYEVITDITKIGDNDFDTIQTGQLAVRFTRLTDQQKRLLARFLANYTRRPV